MPLTAEKELRPCKQPDADPDDWFIDARTAKTHPDYKKRRKAIQACWTDCPVRARLLCLEDGLNTLDLEHGIWGGYTEEQRQEITAERERRRAVKLGRIADDKRRVRPLESDEQGDRRDRHA